MLIIYLTFTKKNARDARKEKKIKSVCDFVGLRSNKLHYKCKECKKGQLKPINGLIKNVPNIHQFCKGDIKKFALLLRKCVYTYEYMDHWEIFDETSRPNKKDF